MSDHPKDFRELVTWAVWQVIEGVTKGQPLERVMTGVLDYALRWRADHE